MKQFDPIFFGLPTTKWNRCLHKGGGGDGGAADRKEAEDARIAAGIKKVNSVFGMGDALPETVDRNNFYTTTQSGGAAGKPLQGLAGLLGGNASGGTTRTFNEAGYNAAVAAAQAKADNLKGAGAQRENLYGKIGQDAQNVAMLDLNRERGITERELGFQLARSGLTGGSRDIDANRDVLDTFQQGALKAANFGTQTANNARSNDEKTRVGLINSITAGLTEGDAVTQAYTGLANNARSAQDEANNTTLAGFFDVIRQQQEKAAYNAGSNSVLTPTAPQKTASRSSASYGGTVRG